MFQPDPQTCLNVGCGPHYAPGWTNVDVHPDRGGDHEPDRICSALELAGTFQAERFERAYVGHVLEHIPLDDVPAALWNLKTVLAPDADLMVVGPDLVRMAEAVHKGQRTWDDFWDGHGTAGQDKDWDPGYSHKWNSTLETAIVLLRCAGYVDLQERDPFELWQHPAGWPVVSGAPGQFALSARR